MIVVAVFITCLITANITAVKLVSIFGLILPAGVIVFPISYIIDDVLTEVYGFHSARRVIWLGFFCNLIAAREDHFKQLEWRRERRQELEWLRREAERRRGAYDKLHTLLGPRELQGRLLRAAERDLVSLANEALDRLSRGRMTLGLREGDQHRALDLVVYDSDTGANEVAVGLTSGSQRFRIAVSLALAIGRYKGQRARRIQSVIVDEGFGSLDKHSRDDMIQVLNDLRQELDKIILVSHQDEFRTG